VPLNEKPFTIGSENRKYHLLKKFGKNSANKKSGDEDKKLKKLKKGKVIEVEISEENNKTAPKLLFGWRFGKVVLVYVYLKCMFVSIIIKTLSLQNTPLVFFVFFFFAIIQKKKINNNTNNNSKKKINQTFQKKKKKKIRLKNQLS
jgi:hypothetical protein